MKKEPSAATPSMSRFMIISLIVHGLIFGAQYVFGSLYSKADFTVDIAPASIDVAIIEEAEEPPVFIEEKAEEILTASQDTEREIFPAEIADPPPKEPAKPEEAPAPELPEKEVSQVPALPQLGAVTEAKPDYFRNPAPAYPRKARQQGWEGLVVLNVRVNKLGNPESIGIERSSGRSILDEAA